MVILGIDPGTALTGYGVIEFTAGKLVHLTHGVVRTPSKAPLPSRLKTIDDNLRQLFQTYRPDAVAVEQLFFSRNVSSALAVGHARGVALLAAAYHNVSVAEYTPLQVKQAVSGEGRASKTQVAFMVRILLSMDQTPGPDDAADALAIAICHAHSATTAMRISEGRDMGGWAT